jgi:hypothetical protein
MCGRLVDNDNDGGPSEGQLVADDDITSGRTSSSRGMYQTP